jgi:hypothetical protein
VLDELDSCVDSQALVIEDLDSVSTSDLRNGGFGNKVTNRFNVNIYHPFDDHRLSRQNVGDGFIRDDSV